MEKQTWKHFEKVDDIIMKRDECDIDSEDWATWNEVKAEWLENHKPSTKEDIIYFEETALLDVPNGFSIVTELPHIPYHSMRRSLLEYHPEKRHPIPYAIVKHKRRYFFILRKQGSGEIRLVNQVGLIGGHVGVEDVDSLSLNKTILNALRRELHEEAAIDDSIIRSVDLIGLIKTHDGVDADHLGVVYIVELETDDIISQENGVIEGFWVHDRQLAERMDEYESWAKLAVGYLLERGDKSSENE